MFKQWFKRLFPAKQVGQKELLQNQTQTTPTPSAEWTQTSVVQQTAEVKRVSPSVMLEKQKHSCCQEEFSCAALINTSFHNRVLKGTWRGKAGYLQENGKYLNGEIALDIEQCRFYIPHDRLNPFVRIRIKHDTSMPIRFENKSLTISSQEGLKTFSVPEEECDHLQSWLEKRLPKLEKVRTFPKVFLGFSDKVKEFPHPFLFKHARKDPEARKYLTQQFPVFGNSLPWYDGTVSFSVEEKQSRFYVELCSSGEEWTWTETEDQIQIVLRILEVGFFDDSESEFRFEYSITYLGDTLEESECKGVNNSKLSQQLPLSKWSKPDTEIFIVENPFDMSGFYRIQWQTTSH